MITNVLQVAPIFGSFFAYSSAQNCQNPKEYCEQGNPYLAVQQPQAVLYQVHPTTTYYPTQVYTPVATPRTVRITTTQVVPTISEEPTESEDPLPTTRTDSNGNTINFEEEGVTSKHVMVYTQPNGQTFMNIYNFYPLTDSSYTVNVDDIQYFVVQPHHHHVFRYRTAGYWNILQGTVWAAYDSGSSRTMTLMQIKVRGRITLVGFAVGANYSELVDFLSSRGIKQVDSK